MNLSLNRRILSRPATWVVVALAAAAVAAVLAWQQERGPGPGPIRVGYRNQPPFYYAAEGRPAGGMAVEVIGVAAGRLGITVTWTRADGLSDILTSTDRIDVWPTVPVDAQSPGLHATEPWLESTFFLVSRSDTRFDGQRLAGRKVALITVRYGEAMTDRALEGAVRVVKAASEQSLQAVCSGETDAAFIEGRQIQWLLLNRPAGCEGVPLKFDVVPGAVVFYGIGSTPIAAGYADALRDEIARMGEDGTLAAIHSRWSLATANETRLVYALQRARQQARLSLYGTAVVGVAFLVSLWQIHRTGQARRLAEQASKTMAAHARAQERYRLLFERNLAGVVRTTVDGRILDCNQAFARMFGYESKDDLVGVPAWQLYADPRDRESALSKLRQEGAVASAEVHIRRRDGTSGWVLESATQIDEGPGAPATLESTIIDITELRRLEERYRQAQKLESVGRLAGGVAHDFNNLLTAVNGYAELALAELDDANPVRASLEEIRQAGQRAASLTQQLLAFSRKQLLQPVVLDLNDIVTEAEKLLRRLIGEDIQLVTSLEPSLGRVRADPGQIHQVVMNLAVNARDAMPDGGTLTLTTRNANGAPGGDGADPDSFSGPAVLLAVRDTGHGMDAETQRRIFEPFFTTKEVGKGTGLGLSTVYGIVKQSGGHVVLRSEPGCGTTFEIYLPRVAGAEPAH
jgi:PAS domain S-box-containing protein